MPLKVEHLRHLDREPYTVQRYQSWCGHTEEIIPFPREDGSVVIVGTTECPGIGELRWDAQPLAPEGTGSGSHATRHWRRG